MAPSLFNWGAPVDITMPPSGDGAVPPWTDLKFNPLGLYNLRRHIGILAGEPGIFTRYQSRFEAADVAWFAAGASEDNNHHVPADTFHQAFAIMRSNLPSGEEGKKWRKQVWSRLQKIIFDLVRCILNNFVEQYLPTCMKATLWDRAFGSSTIIIHVEGAINPGAPALPEHIKADVYLPPVMISEHPEAHSAIAQIVQTYIEAIGVPTVQRWTHAGKKCGWSLSQPGHVNNPNPIPRPLVPLPLPGTSHYQFIGRPYGILSTSSHATDQSSTNDNPADQSVQPAMSRASEEPGPMISLYNIMDALEEISELKAKLAGADLREGGLIAQVHALFERIQRQAEEITQLRARVLDGNNSSSLSDISSTTDLTSKSPTPDSPSKRNPGNSLALKFPTVDTALFPKPAPLRARPFSPRSSPIPHSALPATPTSSRNLTFPHFVSPATPTSSHSYGPAQLIAQGSHVDEFLREHALGVNMAATIAVIYNLPVPSWFELIRSLDLTEDQRGELLAAMTNDWAAGNA